MAFGFVGLQGGCAMVVGAIAVAAIGCSIDTVGVGDSTNDDAGAAQTTGASAGGAFDADASTLGSVDGTGNGAGAGSSDGDAAAGSSNGVSSSNRDAGAAASAPPAPLAALPQVATSGGAVLASPRFLPITFDGYAYRASVESFVARLGASHYWSATTREYGVGAGTSLGPVHLSGSGGNACGASYCTTDADITAWLAQQFENGSIGYDANTVYTLVFPQNVSIDQGGGVTSCQAFAGYHGEIDLANGAKAVYAVIPTCTSSAGVGLTPANVVTATIGRELIEAATDPHPRSSPAFFAPPDRELGWVLGESRAKSGGELAELCAAEAGSFITDSELPDPTTAGTFQYVQRSWSNAAAAAGQDPCVPHVADPYFNALPVPSESATIPYQHLDGTLSTDAVDVASFDGKTTRVVDVQLIGDPTAGAFTVRAVDYAGLIDSSTSTNGPLSYLTMTWDNGQSAISGTAGQVLHLTVTATNQAGALATAASTDARIGVRDYPFLPIWIGSSMPDSSNHTVEHLSFLLVHVGAGSTADSAVATGL